MLSPLLILHLLAYTHPTCPPPPLRSAAADAVPQRHVWLPVLPDHPQVGHRLHRRPLPHPHLHVPGREIASNCSFFIHMFLDASHRRPSTTSSITCSWARVIFFTFAHISFIPSFLFGWPTSTTPPSSTCSWTLVDCILVIPSIYRGCHLKICNCSPPLLHARTHRPTHTIPHITHPPVRPRSPPTSTATARARRTRCSPGRCRCRWGIALAGHEAGFVLAGDAGRQGVPQQAGRCRCRWKRAGRAGGQAGLADAYAPSWLAGWAVNPRRAVAASQVPRQQAVGSLEQQAVAPHYPASRCHLRETLCQARSDEH